MPSPHVADRARSVDRGSARHWERPRPGPMVVIADARSRGEARMQRFWSNLAVQLGKRAGLVSVVGLLVTIALGLGISNLKFQTGQDSYLNKSQAVYKDNLRYQDLFGGQAMLTVVTAKPGHTVDELLP